MISQLALVSAIIPIVLVGLSIVPAKLADRWTRTIRRFVSSVLGLQIILSIAILLALVAVKLTENGLLTGAALTENPGVSILGVGPLIDGVSSLMLAMVSIVSFTVARYSIRYLDGEATQGRYFRWLGFTVGAVQLLVISGNLLVFFLAWVMTSFGLHQLLLHYRHRKNAHRAAWTKFAISRLGDAFLIAAFGLIYKGFGTFDMSALFEQAKAISDAGEAAPLYSAIGWLIVLGAATKSAQFPCHIWLPNTMETPTPVSALMHAGIVNAGGYLVIRMSPLVALAPEALIGLAALGAFTACFAGVVMMTQPTIKRSLAYSTIAQMGFMMLQCGIGAFSAAMLHLLAHSFYKAHAFLSSGSVVSKAVKEPQGNNQQGKFQGLYFVSAAILATAGFAGAAALLAYDFADKPGGLALAFILWLAVTTWGWRLLASGRSVTVGIATFGFLALFVAYVGSYSSVNSLVASSTATIPVSPMLSFLTFDIALAFVALLVLHLAVFQNSPPAWLEGLRVHASNGFYVDAFLTRLSKAVR